MDTTFGAAGESYGTGTGVGVEDSRSAVTWGAVFAGAFVSAAVALMLLALGAGIGMSSLSPWASSTVAPSAVGMGALIWLAVTQLIASGLGGYIAGRFRTKWINTHTHEVYFRDTAHGFLAWTVAMVASAAMLTAATAVMVGDAHAGSAAGSERMSDAGRYYVDRLFRADQGSVAMDDGTRTEAAAILEHAIAARALDAEDKTYLANTIVSVSGVSSSVATTRVTDVFLQLQQATDAARKAAAHALYWLFVSFLIGAFSASLAATLGGKERDKIHHY